MLKEKVIEVENGEFVYKLEKLLFTKKISINKLMRDTNTDFKVIKRFMNGEMLRIDIIVLARLCNYLKCDMTDIIEYIRDNKE